MLVRRVAAAGAPARIRKQDLRLRGMLAISELEEPSRSLGELVLSGFLCERLGSSLRQQNPRTFPIVGRPELECRLVRTSRGVERIERICAIAGLS